MENFKVIYLATYSDGETLEDSNVVECKFEDIEKCITELLESDSDFQHLEILEVRDQFGNEYSF